MLFCSLEAADCFLFFAKEPVRPCDAASGASGRSENVLRRAIRGGAERALLRKHHCLKKDRLQRIVEQICMCLDSERRR